jgi:hypothetical protein
MMQRWTWKQPVIELLSTFLVIVNLFFFTPGVKAEKQVIILFWKMENVENALAI